MCGLEPRRTLFFLLFGKAVEAELVKERLGLGIQLFHRLSALAVGNSFLLFGLNLFEIQRLVLFKRRFVFFICALVRAYFRLLLFHLRSKGEFLTNVSRQHVKTVALGLLNHIGRLVRVGVLDNRAVLKTHDTRAVRFREFRVVRDHDDETILCDFCKNVHNLHAEFAVQSTRRLVRKNNFWVVDDCTRDCHALHLSAGKLIRTLADFVRHADAV